MIQNYKIQFEIVKDQIPDGLTEEEIKMQCAKFIEEGVDIMSVAENCEYIKNTGTEINSIIATGGGSKSDIWCQLQADITKLPIRIPKEKEAACLGAAIIAAVSDGKIESFEKASEMIAFEKVFTPSDDKMLDKKYTQFNKLYEFSCGL